MSSPPRLNERSSLIAARTLGVDTLVDEIVNNPEGDAAKLFLKAKDLQNNKLKRSYIEACLLASNDYEQISGILEIDQAIIETYSKIFYDTTTLDRLSKLELISVKDKDEGIMKIWAFSQGLDFIAWRLGKSITISPVDGLRDLFNTCIYKSKEAMFNKNASEASKESTKWVKLSVEIARILKVWVMDSEGARRDIEIALKEVTANFKGIDDLEDDESFSLNVSVNTEVKFSDGEDLNKEKDGD